jgi:hypothetical protein
LRMPSRRPRVMPATLSSFVPLIIALSGARETGQFGRETLGWKGSKRTFPTGDTDAPSFDLETERALIFPQRRCDARLHARRLNLTSRVKASRVRRRAHALLADTRKGQHGLWRVHGVGNRRSSRRREAIGVGVLTPVLGRRVLARAGLQQRGLRVRVGVLMRVLVLVRVRRCHSLRRRCLTSGHMLRVVHLARLAVHRWVMFVRALAVRRRHRRRRERGGERTRGLRSVGRSGCGEGRLRAEVGARRRRYRANPGRRGARRVCLGHVRKSQGRESLAIQRTRSVLVIVRSVRRTPGLLLRIGGIQLFGFLPQIASVYLLFAVV